MKIKYIVATAVLAVTVFCSAGAASAVDNSALIAQLQAQIQALLQQISQLKDQQGGTVQPWCYTFNKNLGVGSNGDDVSALYKVLTKEGIISQYDSPGSVRMKFFEETAGDVIKFQAKYGIPQTGFAGPKTRAKLNALYGCKTAKAITDCQAITCYFDKCPGNHLPDEKGCINCSTPCATSTQPAITIIAPNGSEVWKVGERHEIKWSSSNITGNVKIWRGSATGAFSMSAYEIATVPASIGSYLWTVDKYAVGSQMINIVSDSGVTATSKSFTVLNSSAVQPSLNIISGPKTLKIDETGTWQVGINYPAYTVGDLSFYAIWGDEGQLPTPIFVGPNNTSGADNAAKFYHSYARAGNFSPTFIAVDKNNNIGRINTSVAVGSSQPAIINIVPGSMAFTGTTITVNGTNLCGFESDKNLWIENSVGQKGVIYGLNGSTCNTIKFVLADKYCTTDNSYSGLPCSSYLSIVPGTYNIFAQPWGTVSNKVQLKVITSATRPSITITSPNGNSFPGGNGMQIPVSWMLSNIPAGAGVQLKVINSAGRTLYTSGILTGVNNYTIVAGLTAGQYVITGQVCTIGVANEAGPTCSAILATANGNGYFTVGSATQPAITVTSPNGGESYKRGDDILVKWDSMGIDEVAIQIFYYNSDGAIDPLNSMNGGECRITYEPIQANLKSYLIKGGNTGRCGLLTAGEKIKIQISGYSYGQSIRVNDFSDNYFRITQ